MADPASGDSTIGGADWSQTTRVFPTADAEGTYAAVSEIAHDRLASVRPSASTVRAEPSSDDTMIRLSSATVRVQLSRTIPYARGGVPTREPEHTAEFAARQIGQMLVSAGIQRELPIPVPSDNGEFKTSELAKFVKGVCALRGETPSFAEGGISLAFSRVMADSHIASNATEANFEHVSNRYRREVVAELIRLVEDGNLGRDIKLYVAAEMINRNPEFQARLGIQEEVYPEELLENEQFIAAVDRIAVEGWSGLPGEDKESLRAQASANFRGQVLFVQPKQAMRYLNARLEAEEKSAKFVYKNKTLRSFLGIRKKISPDKLQANPHFHGFLVKLGIHAEFQPNGSKREAAFWRAIQSPDADPLQSIADNAEVAAKAINKNKALRRALGLSGKIKARDLLHSEELAGALRRLGYEEGVGADDRQNMASFYRHLFLEDPEGAVQLLELTLLSPTDSMQQAINEINQFQEMRGEGDLVTLPSLLGCEGEITNQNLFSYLLPTLARIGYSHGSEGTQHRSLTDILQLMRDQPEQAALLLYGEITAHEMQRDHFAEQFQVNADAAEGIMGARTRLTSRVRGAQEPLASRLKALPEETRTAQRALDSRIDELKAQGVAVIGHPDTERLMAAFDSLVTEFRSYTTESVMGEDGKIYHVELVGGGLDEGIGASVVVRVEDPTSGPASGSFKTFFHSTSEAQAKPVAYLRFGGVGVSRYLEQKGEVEKHQLLANAGVEPIPVLLEAGPGVILVELMEGGSACDDRKRQPGEVYSTRDVAIAGQALGRFLVSTDNTATEGQRKVVHRDIKPDNLLVRRDEDGSLTVKVADFGGLCRAGTPEWFGTTITMAPEVFLDWVCTEASDIYSAGATVYELLTGSEFQHPNRLGRIPKMDEMRACQDTPAELAKIYLRGIVGGDDEAAWTIELGEDQSDEAVQEAITSKLMAEHGGDRARQLAFVFQMVQPDQNKRPTGAQITQFFESFVPTEDPV